MSKLVTTRVVFEIAGCSTPPPVTTYDNIRELIRALEWAEKENSHATVDILSVHQDKTYTK